MKVNNFYTGLKPEFELNEMQKLAWEYRDTTDNIVVSAKTSSGKTACTYMYGGKYIRSGIPVIYIGSLKALVKEKLEDTSQTEHPWNSVPQAIVSGDYAYDEAKLDEINKALFITITPEALLSKIRNINSAKNDWIKRVGLVVVDEVHLVGDDSRGHNLEVMLIKLTEINPDIQLVGLSGTVPNVTDIAEWFTTLNGKPTHTVVSQYRPVPIDYHFLPFEDDRSSETARIAQIIDIIRKKPDEQFLVGVFKIAFGEMLTKYLKQVGINAEFYNSTLSKPARAELINRFKTGNIKVLVSTSGLFTGVNLPARNVISTHTFAGGNPISAADLQQLGGRAGRFGYDTQGDVYYLIPSKYYQEDRERIITGEPVLSALTNPRVFTTHFLGAINMGYINNLPTFNAWIKRTLLYTQEKMPQGEITQTYLDIVSALTARRMIEDNQGNLTLTNRGRIAAQMFLDPYQFADLIRNVTKYLALSRTNDIELAKIFGQTSLGFSKYTSKMESDMIPQLIKSNTDDCYWKSVYVIWCKVTGKPVPPIFNTITYSLYSDMERWKAGLIRASKESEGWANGEDTLNLIFMRLTRGGSWAEASMRVNKFTKAESTLLAKHGITSYEDALNNKLTVCKLLKPSRLRELKIV